MQLPDITRGPGDLLPAPAKAAGDTAWIADWSLDLAQQGQVEIRTVDVSGRQIRTLMRGKLLAGRHEAIWNGLDDAGHSVASGVYFYQLVTADYRATRKHVVMR